MFRAIGSCLLLIAGSLAVGCGGGDARPGATIEGTVLLDGQPLEMGSVHFTSPQSGETTYANLDSNGKYAVEFPKVDVGQRYLISVDKPVFVAEDAYAPLPPQPKMKRKIPPKYTSRTNSGLEVEIEKGGKLTHDIELSSS